MSQANKTYSGIVNFYHDIEQDFGIEADPAKCREVVKEFLRIEKALGIKATYNIVGKIFETQPDLVEQIAAGGHDLAFHSYYHQYETNRFPEEVEMCRKVAKTVKGYRSPRSSWNQGTLDALWKNGFLWNAESDSKNEPYYIHKGLVRLPIATDDWPMHTGDQSAEEWVRQFEAMLGQKKCFGIGMHDCAASLAPEKMLDAWEKIITMAVNSDTLVLTFSETADLFRRASLSKYYSDTADTWNRDTKVLYRTNRLKELIREEVGKLEQPVVADLGSGGGVLSAHVKDIAKKVYCVDNAPGMVSNVDKNGGIEAWVGEVTESGLPESCIDFVLCSRVIEYLFWPDQLANEIKRVGKKGATYFVSFPALRASAPENEGFPPDRIRHYFSAEEIREWASRIGPGRLIGIQYKNQEPKAEETEDYKKLDEDPPENAQPMNWVFTGTIENKELQRFDPLIPLSAFKFDLQEKRNYQLDLYIKTLGSRLPAPIRKLKKFIPYINKI